MCLFSRWRSFSLSCQNGQGFARHCERFCPGGSQPRPGNATLVAHAKRPVPEQKVCHVDVSVTGWVERSRCQNHRARLSGHGAQAVAVAGIELWLIQGFCQWGSRAVLEYVRDCASATDLAVRVAKGVQLTEVCDSIYERLDCRVEPGMTVATERAFEEALEESVQSCSIGGLMADKVREQIQGRVVQVAGVGPVRFVSCAETSSGRLHIGKTDVVMWCGRRWVHCVSEALPGLTRCRQCLRAVALGVSGSEVQVLDL